MIQERILELFAHTKISSDIGYSFAGHFSPVRKSCVLIEKEQIVDELYFIVEGYLIVESEVSSKKYVRHIAKAGEFVTILDSFVNRNPSKDTVRMIKNSQVYCIQYGDFMNLINTHPELDVMFRDVLLATLIKCQSRITDILTLKADEYYEKLIRETPYILQAIPQYELATYLGIEPQSLSRIRSKI